MDTNNQNQEVDGTPLTFDEILADKEYQSEFDKRVSKAIDTAKSKWEEGHNVELKKQEELAQKLTDTTIENVSLKQVNQVLTAGVNADDMDYVVFKVSKMEGEFEDNLKEFLKDNPKYLQQNETKETPKTTGVPVSKIKADEEDGVLAILKAKHPEAF